MSCAAASWPREATSGSRSAGGSSTRSAAGGSTPISSTTRPAWTCSDHEVNLKILLGLAMQRGELSRDERNALLHEVQDDVVRHVLYDNFQQAQILSQETERLAASDGGVRGPDAVARGRGNARSRARGAAERRGDGRAPSFPAWHDAARARRAPRVREDEPDRRAAVLVAPGLAVPRGGPPLVLPAAGREAVRAAAERAPAATRAHRDARRERRRELPGDHVRVPGGHRDRCGGRGRRARVPDRSRRDRGGRAGGRRSRRRSAPSSPRCSTSSWPASTAWWRSARGGTCSTHRGSSGARSRRTRDRSASSRRPSRPSRPRPGEPNASARCGG